MADWVTISAIASAGGTLVLAGATFASVRSANRAARVAERSMLVGLRPLLVSSRRDDPPQKIHFVDGKYLLAPGGGAALEATGEAVYLGLTLRNAGSGIAVLHGWRLYPGELLRTDEHAPLEEFVRLTRDLYIPAGDVGYWQGSYRDPSTPEFAAARRAIESRQESVVEILYGDEEGGQRRISRFGIFPRDDGWTAESARHWNLDGADPR
jgi:hypothetical protein